MSETPPASAPAPSARVVAIIDPCADFARLLGLLVADCAPGTAVHAFTEAEAARRWVTGAAASVVVLVDADGARAAVAEAATAWSSLAGPVTVVALADPQEPPACREALTPRPVHLPEWRACLSRVLLPASGA